MANEIVKDEFSSGNVEFLEGVQISSQNKIYTDKEISKILFAKSRACVLHTEILDEQVHVSGKVFSNITYLSVDGETESGDAEIEFNEIIKNSKIKQGDQICVSANVIDCLVDSVSVSEVNTTSIVELTPKLVATEKIAYVTGGGDGLYVLDEQFNNKFLIKSGKEELSFEIEVQTRENISKVLDSSCQLCVKNIKARGGIAQVDLNACYNLLLKEDQLKILSDEYQTTEEVVIDGSSEQSFICGKLNVLSCETEIVEGKIILKVNAMLCFDVYEEKTLNFVSDAFSVTNEINLNVISALQNRFAYNFSENAEVVGNISVKDEGFEIRRVIGALPKTLVLSKVSPGQNEVLVEGVASFTAIYEDVDDVIDSVDIEIPFVSNVKNANIEADQMFSTSGCIFDVKAKVRKANEIEISAGVGFCFNVFEKNEFAYVNNIEIGEEKLIDESALTIYVVKDNETLFDIAKKLSVSMADLKDQNPALEDELKEGFRLVVYKQKNVN